MKKTFGRLFMSTLVIVVSLYVMLSAAILLFEPAMHLMQPFLCPGGELVSQKRLIISHTNTRSECKSKKFNADGNCVVDSVYYYCPGDNKRRPEIVVLKTLAIAHVFLFGIIFLVRFIANTSKPAA